MTESLDMNASVDAFDDVLFDEEDDTRDDASLDFYGGTPGERRITVAAAPSEEGLRLDVFLTAHVSGETRSYLQKLIKDGAVTVNGNVSVKANVRVSAADTITVTLPAPAPLDILPENIPLDILYEDEDLLIVNKPKGMVVHPAPGHTSGTLVNAVLFHCGESLSGINGVLRPGIVHRIDRDTTGSLIVCKTDAAHKDIAEQIKAHTVTRVYQGIVIGNLPEDEGTVTGTIGRSANDRKKMAMNVKNGKPAVTHYRVLERFSGYTYVEFRLETGRTHQIRVHLAGIGHPLLGDMVYGARRGKDQLWKKTQGQTLHAMTIGFIHPSTRRYLEISAPLPAYFSQLLADLRQESL